DGQAVIAVLGEGRKDESGVGSDRHSKGGQKENRKRREADHRRRLPKHPNSVKMPDHRCRPLRSAKGLNRGTILMTIAIRRAGRCARFALALAACAHLTGALAEERPIGLDRQTGVAVTIYNENLALVKDRRHVDLAGGTERLAFVDVSAMIRPETALL